jgi:5,5'-dehydrodivanillate O-demethylase
MGELLRRYWMPIAAVAELDDHPTKPVRLMGENLVLYKDKAGNYGLVDRHCPHRRADLSYGWAEDCGLRCHYHGWLWDHTGRCLQQPFEETAHPEARYKDRVRIKAYPVEAKAGLLWAYLGPPPVPLVPTWEPFTWQNGFVQIVFSEVPCNWFQCQENSIDPVHFEWLHSNWSRSLGGGRRPLAHAPEGGLRGVRVRLHVSADPRGPVRARRAVDGRPLLAFGRTVSSRAGHFEWRVPIDDGNMLSVGWFFDRVPNEMEPYRQDRIPYWHSPIKDPLTDRWITSHVMNQDFVAWVGQGIVADRTQEHLGESDRGVIMMRRRILEDAERVARGEEPKAIIRDPEKNRCVRLPIIGRDFFVNGASNVQNETSRQRHAGLPLRKEFPFLTGQPEEVRAAYRRAMGLPEPGVDARSPAAEGATWPI